MIVLLFSLVKVQAADWDMFPTDSIRWYGLYGIDYRDVITTSEGVTLQLEGSSKYRVLDVEPKEEYHGRTYYRTGNSVFGNHIVKTEGFTFLVLVNDSIREQTEDTFTLLNDPSEGKEWTCYEDHSILITAKNEELTVGTTPIGTDSIRSIKIRVYNKTTVEELFYTIKAGKRFGLMQFFDVAEFMRFNHYTHYTDIYDLKPYREMTVTEFYTILPGTETHTYTGVSFEPGSWAIQNYYATKFYLKNGELVKDVVHLETRDQMFPGGESIRVWDTTTAESVFLEQTGDNIINPLPTESSMFQATLTIGTYCEDSYILSQCISEQCGNSWEYLSEDTVVEIMGVYDGRVRIKRFVSGVGKTYESYQAGVSSSVDILLRTDYLKKQSCTTGKPIGKLTSIENHRVSYVSFSPVPANDFINLHVDEHLKHQKVKVCNIAGIIVLNDQLIAGRLDITSLPSGIYYLQLEDNDTLYKGKFVKN